MTPCQKTKKCSGCGRLLKIIIGLTFNRKTKAWDGLQPFCRECDARQKGERTKGWARFQHALRERGLGEEAHWSRGKYESLMGDFACHYCGNPVENWSSGYWVDKVSSDRGYKPDNVVPCCWPCNCEKSNYNPEAWHHTIAGLVGPGGRYKRGAVPWDEIAKYRHSDNSIPSLAEYEVEAEQIDLFASGTGT